MKRILRGVPAMVLTFAVGVGISLLFWVDFEVHSPAVETVPAAMVQPATVPAAIVRPVAEPVSEVTEATTAPITPQSMIILDYDDQMFYPNGTYHILGSTPKEFAEFYSFETDYGEWVNDRPVGYIAVNTKAGGGIFDRHDVVFGLITERRVVFLTSPDPKTEFEYLFDGQFIRSDFDVVANKDKAVVRGTLTKWRRGEKIAERVLSFSMVQHGC
ncbi:MAG TPA: hypothetical protein VFR78_00815 [Pyrinomonadaceae bacterium]|nr:hypothetical protein [Pyrinomonadaceae bacterium]